MRLDDGDCDSSSQQQGPSSSSRSSSSSSSTSFQSITTRIQLNSDAIKFNECLRRILHDNNLPIGYGVKKRNVERAANPSVWAHHLEANTKKWNDQIRFDPLPILTDNEKCVVWEVGAHTEARDSQTLMETYPSCEYHAYEPILPFFEKLERHWQERGSKHNMHVHNYGLADRDAKFHVEESIASASQSTFILGAAKMKNQKEGFIPINIKSFENAVQDAGGIKPNVLHMNCEGCEWDMLPQAVNTGFIQGIDVIQVGTHNYGSVGLGARVWQLCEIRAMLSQTHVLVEGAVPFGWERWVLKK